MNNKVVVTIVSTLLIFGFLILAYKFINTPQNTTFPEVGVVRGDEHIKWFNSKNSKNILVEYSDLQCPACKTFQDLIRSEIEASASPNFAITKNVTFIYRHFPLPQHTFANDAAYAAEAAGKQGNFFEMVDMIFDSQTSWEKKPSAKEDFEQFAKNLKLDMDQFRKDRDSKEVKDKVQSDLLSGEKAAVNATPTFFLNGKKLDNMNSFADFVKLLKNP